MANEVSSFVSNNTSYPLLDAAALHPNGTTAQYYRGDGSLATFPTIPTVNNGTLTIQNNGTTVATFGANQSTSVTANITAAAPGNGTLTIKRNNTSVGTFSANQTANTAINITVPTNTSDLNNDSNFTTTSALNNAITAHNADTEAHADIRTSIPKVYQIRVIKSWESTGNRSVEICRIQVPNVNLDASYVRLTGRVGGYGNNNDLMEIDVSYTSRGNNLCGFINKTTSWVRGRGDIDIKSGLYNGVPTYVIYWHSEAQYCTCNLDVTYNSQVEITYNGSEDPVTPLSEGQTEWRLSECDTVLQSVKDYAKLAESSTIVSGTTTLIDTGITLRKNSNNDAILAAGTGTDSTAKIYVRPCGSSQGYGQTEIGGNVSGSYVAIGPTNDSTSAYVEIKCTPPGSATSPTHKAVLDNYNPALWLHNRANGTSRIGGKIGFSIYNTFFDKDNNQMPVTDPEGWFYMVGSDNSDNNQGKIGCYVDGAIVAKNQLYFNRSTNVTSLSSNADKVDGYHIVVGSTGTNTATLYFN